jgi:CubicO group peptidase (beta-lactamase class C family)
VTLPQITPAWRDQSAHVAWPTQSWPRTSSTSALDALCEELFESEELSTTNALIIVRGGEIALERYGGAKVYFDRPEEPIVASTPLLSWSVAKSMTHFLVGVLVDEGRLNPDARAEVAEWSDSHDPRHAIRLADLLAMRDGLDFLEDYVDDSASDCIEMLFGAGSANTSGYAAARPLRHTPDTVYNYSSGTTNIISRLVAQRVGFADAYRAFLQQRLFDPLGMSSAKPGFDDAGVFIGSTFVHATAQDFARFGLLYLRGGTWDGRQLVSREWTATAQIPHSRDPDNGEYYSWQWWLNADRYGTYWANGYEGQRVFISPALDTVVVRLGKMPVEKAPALANWRDRLLNVLAR